MFENHGWVPEAIELPSVGCLLAVNGLPPMWYPFDGWPPLSTTAAFGLSTEEHALVLDVLSLNEGAVLRHGGGQER
jgi:hypothetical protein